MDALDSFKSKFTFDPELVGFTGIEREFFVTNMYGVIVPMAHDVLIVAQRDPRHSHQWGPELSACQIEYKTRPCENKYELETEIRKGGYLLKSYASACDLKISTQEVGSTIMPLCVSCGDQRYINIAASLHEDQLVAACRVIGTHIQRGMRDLSHAIAASNLVQPHIAELTKLGDHSDGLRMQLYRQVAPHCMPPIYENEEDYYATALNEGFARDPSTCWHLVRINPAHGTLELRMFGTTDDVEELMEWNARVDEILKPVL